jgi:hypothetical protein
VYAGRDYIERHGVPATPADLNAHRLVGFEGSIERIGPARWLEAVAPQAQISYRSNSILGLLFAAQSSFGLTLLPCHVGDPECDLVRVIDPQPELTYGFWLLTHPDLHKRPKIRAFFDFMVEEIVKYRPLLLGQTRPLRGETGDVKAAADQPERPIPPSAVDRQNGKRRNKAAAAVLKRDAAPMRDEAG